MTTRCRLDPHAMALTARMDAATARVAAATLDISPLGPPATPSEVRKLLRRKQRAQDTRARVRRASTRQTPTQTAAWPTPRITIASGGPTVPNVVTNAGLMRDAHSQTKQIVANEKETRKLLADSEPRMPSGRTVGSIGLPNGKPLFVGGKAN